MNKIRKTINKRIKSATSAAVYNQKDNKVITNGHLTWGHIHGDREMNTEEEVGSRSLAFCKRVDEKANINGQPLKVHKKRKRKTKDRKHHNAAQHDGTQDVNSVTESSPHLSTTTEDNVSCVADSYEVKSFHTHKPCKVCSVMSMSSCNLELPYQK